MGSKRYPKHLLIRTVQNKFDKAGNHLYTCQCYLYRRRLSKSHNMENRMELSDFELEVMQIFWDQPKSASPAIHQIIKQKRPVTYSTVKTIIDRLEKKGALTRSDLQGRTIFYSPLVERNQLRKPMIKDFINRVFLGKSQSLAAHILQEEELSLDDVSYLESLLEQRKKELK